MNEIERKFLIWEDGKAHYTELFANLFGQIKHIEEEMSQYAQNEGHDIEQGYLPLEIGYQLAKMHELEVPFFPSETRLRWTLEEATFCAKDANSLKRKEAETKILDMTHRVYWPITQGNQIFKKRFYREMESKRIEINYFLDRDLIMAEVEFQSIEDAVRFPDLGKDVTENRTYYNVNLAK